MKDEIEEFINSSEKIKKRFSESAIFHQSIKSLQHGGDYKMIILELCKIIERQEERLKNYALNSQIPITYIIKKD